jgi:hypothetical protein
MLKPAVGIRQGELDKGLRRLARRSDQRIERFLDPARAPLTQQGRSRIDAMMRTGIDRLDAEAIYASKVQHRAETVRARRKGRHPEPAHVKRRKRWTALHSEVECELRAAWEYSPTREREPAPSAREIAAEIARRDALAHPADWSAYQMDRDGQWLAEHVARRAEDRVRKALADHG